MRKPTSPRRAAHLAARRVNRAQAGLDQQAANLASLFDAIAQHGRGYARNLADAIAQHTAATGADHAAD